MKLSLSTSDKIRKELARTDVLFYFFLPKSLSGSKNVLEENHKLNDEMQMMLLIMLKSIHGLLSFF